MIEVDDKKVFSMFKELSSTNRNRALGSAIGKSLSIVKKKAESNLKSSISGSITKRDKWGNSLKRGIKVKVEKGSLRGKVHIMGNFKLKFFQNGTEERRIKKFRTKRYRAGEGPKRGFITASNFFTNAVDSEERNVIENLDRLISQSIVRINNKYQ